MCKFDFTWNFYHFICVKKFAPSILSPRPRFVICTLYLLGAQIQIRNNGNLQSTTIQGFCFVFKKNFRNAQMWFQYSPMTFWHLKYLWLISWALLFVICALHLLGAQIQIWNNGNLQANAMFSKEFENAQMWFQYTPATFWHLKCLCLVSMVDDINSTTLGWSLLSQPTNLVINRKANESW